MCVKEKQDKKLFMFRMMNFFHTGKHIKISTETRVLFIDTTSDDEFLGLCNCELREQETLIGSIKINGKN
jgi:hypothetical protein